MYTWDLNVIWRYKYVFLKGTIVTVELTIYTIIFGTLLGLVLALLFHTKNSILRYSVRIFIEFFRSIPVLVLLIWVFYSVPALLAVRLSGFTTAVICFTLSLSAFVAESVRSGFESIPTTQIDAAKIIGMTRLQTIKRIVLPQVIRQTIPNLMNQYITLLKLSSLASIIAVNELFHSASDLISSTYRPLEIYSFIAIVYILMVIAFSQISKKIESKIILKVAGSKDNLKKIAWWDA